MYLIKFFYSDVPDDRTLQQGHGVSAHCGCTRRRLLNCTARLNCVLSRLSPTTACEQLQQHLIIDNSYYYYRLF